MGKKGLVASIFSKPKLAAADRGSPPWPWPSCARATETDSFRRHGEDDHRQPCAAMCKAAAGDMYKTVNSVYFDAAAAAGGSCSFFFDDEKDAAGDGNGGGELELDDGSLSTTTASEEWSEAVIRSLGRTSTDRFFFDAGPPPASNSILAASPSPSPGRRMPVPPEPKTPAAAAAAPAILMSESSDADDEEEEEGPSPSPSTSLVEESVAVALDSEDPFRDFRESMAEMVAAHGLRDWAALQEMLLWYLRVNGKHNHALIVGAFVDLLVGLASTGVASAATTVTTTTATTTTTGASSSSSSSSSSSTTSASVAAATVGEEGDEQCGGGSAGASCSSVSSDREEDEDEQEPPMGKKLAATDAMARGAVSLIDSCH
ncbi:hypothetical protein ACP4OV_014565 [Aristida adscensionis]